MNYVVPMAPLGTALYRDTAVDAAVWWSLTAAIGNALTLATLNPERGQLHAHIHAANGSVDRSRTEQVPVERSQIAF